MSPRPFTRLDMARQFLCRPFYIMLFLMVIEALLAAAVTWLVIRAGRDIANEKFLIQDLVFILLAQSASYVVGATSWIFAERAGFLAFGRYMLRFARDNRGDAKVLGDKAQRELVEPFLTSETFDALFDLLSEIEGNLRLLLALIFNVIVLGTEIDSSFPIAYAAVLASLLAMQIAMRQRIAEAYLNNQRMTNRMTAQGYTAWDNVFAGNRHNLRLWLAGFKVRLRAGMVAQIKAIMTREGLSAASGIVGLSIVFATMVYVAARNSGDMTVLIGLAATLPRQIELTHEVHLLASGWNDFLAAWTRIGGAVDHMHPAASPAFDRRVKFDRLVLKEGDETRVCTSLDEALTLVWSRPHGRVVVRGPNGAGKSSLLAMLKSALKNRAYYWPTADRLAFAFAKDGEAAPVASDGDGETDEPSSHRPKGYSSGERQLRALREIVAYTDAPIYLLDEWDANLDLENRAAANAMVEELAARARVVEISHRDREKV